MTNKGRFGLLALAVAIAVFAFVLARPEESSRKADDLGRQQAQTQPTATADSAQPAPREITVRGGRPVGGLEEIAVESGERVRLEVRSADTSDEVHVHGYDLSENLAPGRPAAFSFEATLEGVFEIELEGAGVEIASLAVGPS